jgi:hypothetical protein
MYVVILQYKKPKNTRIRAFIRYIAQHNRKILLGFSEPGFLYPTLGYFVRSYMRLLDDYYTHCLLY